MKAKVILVSILSFSLLSTAEPAREADSSSEVVRYKAPQAEEAIVVPTSISLSKSPFDMYFRNSVLAPCQGTELALNLSQSQYNFGSNYET